MHLICNHALYNFEFASINSINKLNPHCKLTVLSQAFIPSESILAFFESLENYRTENSEIDTIMEIFKYLEDNFIVRLHRDIRQ
ncbi:hypothetical protein HZS_4596 [Henneguya salminicola]|nr:hypothetical protein HZS_4596 [Henneguya salminicola]